MYKYLISSVFIVATLLIASCQDKMETKKSLETEDKSIKFELNNGNKWQMDDHTRTAIENLDSILISHQSLNSTNEYQQLAEMLDEELIKLIRGCTMDGPDHDQLHVFLGYFYPKLQELKKESKLELSKAIFADLKYLMSEYHKYFE